MIRRHSRKMSTSGRLPFTMVSLDTETTGPDLFHGCRPFMVTACTDTGDTNCWEWDVDPQTRIPKVRDRDLNEIEDLISDADSLIFHNAKFDIRGLEMIGLKFSWDKVHDTLIASHVLDSAEDHGLKSLALRYLSVEDDDQNILKQSIRRARNMVRTKAWGHKKWRTADKGDPHFPMLKSAPPGVGWQAFDTWLPRAVALDQEYPSDHPWWTVCSDYGIMDAERTMALWLVFSEALEEEGLLDLYETRRKLLKITYEMEDRGVTLHLDRAKKARMTYINLAYEKERDCYTIGALSSLTNVRSPVQLQTTLFDQLGVEPITRTKAGWSTGANDLREMLLQEEPKSEPYKFIQSLLQYRELSKAVDYLESYMLGGIPYRIPSWLILHPGFNITGTATTRFSSSYPNAQNISKKEDLNLRDVFGPLPGRIWYAADYDNIEFRIFAYGSEDKNLIESFEAGVSMHLLISELLHPKMFKRLGPEKFKKTQEYRWVKNGDFALIYGGFPRTVDRTYRVPGAYDRIKRMLPKVDSFIGEKEEEARRNGYVEILGGYRLQVTEKPRKASNYYCQGSAGWVIILAMIRVAELLEKYKDHWMIMTIHDELVYDFPEPSGSKSGNLPKMRGIKRLMEQSGEDLGLPTPISVERIKTTWAQGEALKLGV